MRGLPIPPHFDAAEMCNVWRVEYAARAADATRWAAQHAVAPASRDDVSVGLLLIDCQNTFCTPGFELFVGGRSGDGAVQDNIRLCRFIYRHLDVITEIIPTLDTHDPLQIFHPAFWTSSSGEHPDGGLQIDADVLARKDWSVNASAASALDATPQEIQRYAEHYVETLGRERYQLMVWPYHAMLGGIGHALVSGVEEAIFFHSIVRNTRPRFELKGSNPLTEHYSIFRPEVMQDADGVAIAERNTALIEHLLSFDAVIVAGQAKSHCVAWSIRDLLTEITARDPSLARKLYLLEDCTSAVVIPGVDFTDDADAAFAEFAESGAHLIRSTDTAPWLAN